VKFLTDHFVFSAVPATVGYMESDTNKCRIVVASGQKETKLVCMPGTKPIMYDVPDSRLDVDVVY
jgi:hypothetical protein